MKRTVTLTIADSLEELTPEELGALVAQGKTLEKVFKAAGDFVKEQLRTGKPVPGWALVPGRRTREWLSEEDAKAALAKAGVNDPYKRELYSVAEAEKLPNMDADTLKPAWKWVDGSKTLGPAPIGTPTQPNYGF